MLGRFFSITNYPAYQFYKIKKLSYAMVTNHLRAPYGVYFTKNRTILRRPYGARPAAGRIVRFLINFLDIVRCPVNFRYYLKFHGARTAFGRVTEDKITSAGHRTVPGRRLHTSDGHRTIFDWDLYRTIPTVPVRVPYGARPGIVRCLTSARNFKKSLNKSADARPDTGRCPSGHRPMFYESNCHRWETTCFAEIFT